MQAATYATITPAKTGRATALYNATSQVGSSLGVAVAAALLTSRLTSHASQLGNPVARAGALDSFQDVYLVMAVIGFACAAVALFVNDRAAAPTMSVKRVEVEGVASELKCRARVRRELDSHVAAEQLDLAPSSAPHAAASPPFEGYDGRSRCFARAGETYFDPAT